MKKIQVPMSDQNVEAPVWLVHEMIMGNIESHEYETGKYLVKTAEGVRSAEPGDWIFIESGQLHVSKEEPKS